MTNIYIALILGILFRQLLRFQGTLQEFAVLMARAENNKRKPIEYQNMMTPRWLVALHFALLAYLIFLVEEDLRLVSWLTALGNILAFLGGLLFSAGFSSITQLPSSKVYALCALKTLSNREADFRKAMDSKNMEAATHFRWLLSLLCGLSDGS
jgi:hypothetical protein